MLQNSRVIRLNLNNFVVLWARLRDRYEIHLVWRYRLNTRTQTHSRPTALHGR